MADVNFFIPAGGEGRRLMPLTIETPKPLLPVAKNRNDFERIIDTPIRIAKNLGVQTMVSGHYKAPLVESYFKDSPVRVVTDERLLHIGGSMILHSEELMQNNPDYVVMIPGDHDVPEAAIRRLIETLEATDAEIALLGTWKYAYHETYMVGQMKSNRLSRPLHSLTPDESTDVIASLGTYAFRADWLRKRMFNTPVTDSGYCDLTTDLVFGHDQDRAPHLVFEPLLPEEYWQDIGTVKRLYEHIRHFNKSKVDGCGNISLDSKRIYDATESVVYVDATQPEMPLRHSFIAKGFSESYN